MYVDNLYGNVDFVHCPLVGAPEFFNRILQVGHLGPDAVLVNIFSNDLASSFVSELSTANQLLGLMKYLVDNCDVKHEIFVSEQEV